MTGHSEHSSGPSDGQPFVLPPDLGCTVSARCRRIELFPKAPVTFWSKCWGALMARQKMHGGLQWRKS